MVPVDTVHMFTIPPLFVTRGSLILDVVISSYSIYQFLYFFLYFTLRQTRGKRQSRGRRHHIQRPAAPETVDLARPLPLLDKGVTKNRTAVYPTVASTCLSLLFPYFFTLKRMSINPPSPADLSGRRLPAHSATDAAPPVPPPNRAHHRDTQDLVLQGLRTDIGHPGGGTRRFGYHATEGDNPDGSVIQQPAGLRHEGRCDATIPRQCITGRCGVGVARPAQRVGDRFHALSRAGYGELRDQVEGVRGEANVRDSGSVG